jgi:hypothetical protein
MTDGQPSLPVARQVASNSTPLLIGHAAALPRCAHGRAIDQTFALAPYHHVQALSGDRAGFLPRLGLGPPSTRRWQR